MLTDAALQQAEAEFKKVIEHLKNEYSHLQIGRASPALVESVLVEAYGTKQALKAVASVSIPDARTIQIQPWDKGLLKAIDQGISMAGLNLTPTNDGLVIRINIPQLTQERRKDLTKVVHRLAEEARISIRHGRQQSMDKIKALEKNKEITEDEASGSEKRLQDKVDAANREVDTIAKNKESDVMTI